MSEFDSNRFYRIAIGTLVRHLPDLRLAMPLSQLRYQSRPVVRALEKLPVF